VEGERGGFIPQQGRRRNSRLTKTCVGQVDWQSKRKSRVPRLGKQESIEGGERDTVNVMGGSESNILFNLNVDVTVRGRDLKKKPKGLQIQG